MQGVESARRSVPKTRTIAVRVTEGGYLALENEVWKRSQQHVLAHYPDAHEPDLHKLIIRNIIDVQVQDVVATSAVSISKVRL